MKYVRIVNAAVLLTAILFSPIVIGYLAPLLVLLSVGMIYLARTKPHFIARLGQTRLLAWVPTWARATPLRLAIIGALVIIPLSLPLGIARYAPKHQNLPAGTATTTPSPKPPLRGDLAIPTQSPSPQAAQAIPEAPRPTATGTTSLGSPRPTPSIVTPSPQRTTTAPDMPTTVSPSIAQSATLLHSLQGPSGRGPVDVVLSPDGKTLIGLYYYGVVLWDMTNGRAAQTLSLDALAIALSPDGTTLAVGKADGKVVLWDIATWQEACTFSTGSSEVRTIRFSPDGKVLATGERFVSGPQLWDVATGQLLYAMKGHNIGVSEVAFSPDGKRLASVDSVNDASIRIWDATNGQSLFILNTAFLSSGANAVTFSPNGTEFASGHANGEVKIWSLATGKELRTLKPTRTDTESIVDTPVMYSPDGRILASGYQKTSTAPAVNLWYTVSGRAWATLEGFPLTITAVAFSPDGKLLTVASPGWPGLLKVWAIAY